MRHSMRRQGGIGFLGLIFFLALILFFVALIVKLGPHYMEYINVRTMMNDLAEEPDLADAVAETGVRRIQSSIAKRIDISQIYGVQPKQFKVKRTQEGYSVNVDYKKEEHLFANVDAIMTFHYEVPLVRK